MGTGKHQHIVPQQMIKRFAAADGKLVGLHKPRLSIGKRRRSPKGILFKDNFYRDNLSDFDEELLQPIEHKFAEHYSLIADHKKPEPLSGEGGAALIDWIAAMLCRTKALSTLSQIVAQKENPLYAVLWKGNERLANNIIRSAWFEECQDFLSRPEFCWKIRIFPDECSVVITDNPVCQANGLSPGGQVTIVPISRTIVLFGGHKEAVERCREIDSETLNAFLAAWAGCSIFAADASVLEEVKKNLEGKGNVGTKKWCEAARKPFFGLAERIKLREPPSDIDIDEWWNNLKDGFGDSILS